MNRASRLAGQRSLGLAGLVLGMAALLVLVFGYLRAERVDAVRRAAEPMTEPRAAGAQFAESTARRQADAARAPTSAASSAREAAAPEAPTATPAVETHVFGTVLDPNAVPVPGAGVSAVFVHADQRTPLGRATSDTAGEYRIGAPGLHALTPYQRSLGWVHVTADAAGFRVSRQRAAPAATPDASLRVDVVVQRGPTVSGRVLAPGGAPAGGAAVFVTCARLGSLVTELTDADGRFRAPLLGSLERIVASAPGLGVFERTFQVAASEPTQSLEVGDLVLETRSTAAGWLVCADGGGLPGIEVALRGEANAEGRRQSARGETEADGYFRFVGLAPGEYALSLASNGFVLGELVTDRPGERYTVEVRTVRVRVHDAAGVPVPGVQVRAFPVGEELGSTLYRDVPTERIGTTHGVEGACVLRLSTEKEFVISTEVVHGAFAESFLGARSSCAQELTLTLGGGPRARLALDVRRSDGVASTSYEVELLSPRTGELRYYLEAEEVDAAADACDLAALEPSTYELLVTPVGEAARYLLPTSLPLTLSAGVRTPVRVELAAGGHLRARIELGADGAGALVRARLLALDGDLCSLLEDGSAQGVSAFFEGGKWGDAERPAPPGAYTLELRASGFRARTLPVELRAGETTSVEVALDPG